MDGDVGHKGGLFSNTGGSPKPRKRAPQPKKVMASLNWLALCIYSWHSLPCNASVWQPSFGGLSKYNDPFFRCKFNQHIYIIYGRWWLRGLLLPYLLLPWPQKNQWLGLFFYNRACWQIILLICTVSYSALILFAYLGKITQSFLQHQ